LRTAKRCSPAQGNIFCAACNFFDQCIEQGRGQTCLSARLQPKAARTPRIALIARLAAGRRLQAAGIDAVEPFLASGCGAVHSNRRQREIRDVPRAD
jgi:hypothetical protein